MNKLELPVTSGDIRRTLDAEPHEVNYILSSRGIKPIGRIGIARVFAPDVVDQVREELRTLRARRRSAEVSA